MKRRYLAGSGLLVIAAAVLTISPPQQTLASWTDSEYTRGSFTAGTLAPTATTVTLPSSLLSIGSGTFSLTATGPGGWTSIVVTGDGRGVVRGHAVAATVVTTRHKISPKSVDYPRLPPRIRG